MYGKILKAVLPSAFSSKIFTKISLFSIKTDRNDSKILKWNAGVSNFLCRNHFAPKIECNFLIVELQLVKNYLPWLVNRPSPSHGSMKL